MKHFRKKKFVSKRTPLTPKKGQEHYVLYTDGSFRLPNCGAWAAVILKDDKVWHTLSGYEFDTTISRMELTAIVKGLEKIPENSHVTLYSDSTYAVNSIYAWIKTWEKHNWVSPSTLKPVANKDLMITLSALKKKYDLDAHHVKAHNGDKYNEECDRLAQNLTSLMVKGVIEKDPEHTSPTPVITARQFVPIPSTASHGGILHTGTVPVTSSVPTTRTPAYNSVVWRPKF